MRKFLFVVLFVWMVAPAIADDQCPMGYTPTKYTQLEYIESTGTQYIDTGVYLTGDIEYEIKLKVTQQSSGVHTYFGAWNVWSSSGYVLPSLGTYAAYKILDNFVAGAPSDVGIDAGVKEGQIGIIKLGRDSISWSEGISTSLSRNSFTTTSNVYLFACNTGGSASEHSVYPMYYSKFWNGGTLIRNFIPAKRNSDGEVGMYDTVTGHFFTNAGTGEFIAGPEILTENTCFPCPPNTYKDFVGNGDCTPCPDTFSSPSGAKSINECGRILHIGDYVAHMPVGRRTEHGLCTMFEGKKYCADVYERQ